MWTAIGIIALGAAIVYTIAEILGYVYDHGYDYGYDAAVCDIMRYGFYIKNGERHEVKNIRIWSD